MSHTTSNKSPILPPATITTTIQQSISSSIIPESPDPLLQPSCPNTIMPSIDESPGCSLEKDSVEQRKQTVLLQASNNTLANKHFLALERNLDLLDPSAPRIKKDIIRLIVQYLTDQGYLASMVTLQDEANVRTNESVDRHTDLKRLRRSILDGDWLEVDKLVMGSSTRASALLGKHYKPFLYSLCKQQFLELIENHEVHKAFNFMIKRIKPLETYQPSVGDVRDLCYLLTAKSVLDSPTFCAWEGVQPSRERLAEQVQAMVDLECVDRDVFIPPDRLVTLLRQAVAYQVDFARYHPKVSPKIQTLLEDHTTLVIPNAKRHTLSGHQGNVKSVAFVGIDGRYLISGSSDNTARIWNTESGTSMAILESHTSRIWDVASDPLGKMVATGSGDGTICLWDVDPITQRSDLNTPALIHTPTCVLTGGQGDVYACSYHPAGQSLVTGGYDRCIRLWDVCTNQIIKTFAAETLVSKHLRNRNTNSYMQTPHAGHALAVTSVTFTPMGNSVLSGSKDATVRFWDLVSGLCVRTLQSHLGEVTSVSISPSGTYLLTSSKDNANRVWDMRMLPKPICRLKGHTNTAKNFIRASFAGPSDGMLVIGGSEDGVVYVWDRESGCVLQRLCAHTSIVYDVKYNARQQLFASCSEDWTLQTWDFDPLMTMDDG